MTDEADVKYPCGWVRHRCFLALPKLWADRQSADRCGSAAFHYTEILGDGVKEDTDVEQLPCIVVIGNEKGAWSKSTTGMHLIRDSFGSLSSVR